jgi:hypothetical protein
VQRNGSAPWLNPFQVYLTSNQKAHFMGFVILLISTLAAENPMIPGSAIEDSFKMDIHCKFEKFFFPLLLVFNREKILSFSFTSKPKRDK